LGQGCWLHHWLLYRHEAGVAAGVVEDFQAGGGWAKVAALFVSGLLAVEHCITVYFIGIKKNAGLKQEPVKIVKQEVVRQSCCTVCVRAVGCLALLHWLLHRREKEGGREAGAAAGASQDLQAGGAWAQWF
jgi:hypothetical protein